jgi:hypothetical protein
MLFEENNCIYSPLKRIYIYSVGNMHVAKLKSAFELLITPINFNHSNEQIEVFDWGCHDQ